MGRNEKRRKESEFGGNEKKQELYKEKEKRRKESENKKVGEN